MSEHYCPRCGPKWSGAFNLDHCCVTCGTVIKTRDEISCCERLRQTERELAEARKQLSMMRGA